MASPRNALSPRSRAYRKPETVSLRGRSAVVLPLEHDIPVPPAPPGVQFTPEERKLWRQLWKGPQGHAWDESYSVPVATYVKYSTRLFAGEGAAWLGQEQRHLGEALGLTPRGMAALGWIIEGTDE